uniref:Uncharacterized protein n=1 Tax=Coleopteran phasma-related virus OKIAV236 TaxID=2746310 RepID=A0A7D7FLU1_9VIRU|nr:hypothetical protein [Coleopteran phasma-related virus OKIAV236]
MYLPCKIFIDKINTNKLGFVINKCSNRTYVEQQTLCSCGAIYIIPIIDNTDLTSFIVKFKTNSNLESKLTFVVNNHSISFPELSKKISSAYSVDNKEVDHILSKILRIYNNGSTDYNPICEGCLCCTLD